MTEYTVQWTIDLEGDNPRDAAIRALEIQRDPDSLADVFQVTDPDGTAHEVDLSDVSQLDRETAEMAAAAVAAMAAHLDPYDEHPSSMYTNMTHPWKAIIDCEAYGCDHQIRLELVADDPYLSIGVEDFQTWPWKERIKHVWKVLRGRGHSITEVLLTDNTVEDLADELKSYLSLRSTKE